MKKSGHEKDGIALVAVLGFLGIMLLMAVSLSISMRTERLTAESARDDARTKELARTAVVRAMADINGFMVRTNPATGLSVPVNQQPAMIHLPRELVLFESVAELGSGTPLGSGVDLISGEMREWLPAKYLSSASEDYDAEKKANEKAQWIYIKDPAATNILGRIGYLVVDCTGLLDANLINDGGNPVRNNGTSPGEINAKHLPEVQTSGQAANMEKNRLYYKRFASIPEIIYLNDANDAIDSYNEVYAVDGEAMDNLAPYSLSYDRGWWQWGDTNSRGWQTTFPVGSVLVPLHVDQWTEDQAKLVFDELGFDDDYNVQEMAYCFEDYVDEDLIPGGSTEPNVNVVCGEPIPMINEIAAVSQVESDGVNYTHTVTISVEVWYPFAPSVVNSHSYSLTLAAQPFMACIPAGLVPTTPVDALNDRSVTVSASAPYARVDFRFNVQALVASIPAANRFLRWQELGGFTLQINDTTAGQVVDEVVLPRSPALSVHPPGLIDLTPRNAAWPQRSGTMMGLSCTDPRINHLVNHVSPKGTYNNWERIVPSLLGQNNNANFNVPAEFVGNTPPVKEGTLLYVRNSRDMESVAELGFLPTGWGWTTIDLLSARGATLLSKFRVGDWNTNTSYRAGLINPHSLNTGVWSSVLMDCPLDQYPGEEDPDTLDVSFPGNIAKIITDFNAAVGSWGTNSFDGFADWAAVPGLGTDAPFWAGKYNNMQKEAIVRNTYRLMNPNQNLFTIIVVAQAINDQGVRGVFDSNTDTILGEKRAVALVWRDPFPNKAGRNEMFIRMLRYIDQ